MSDGKIGGYCGNKKENAQRKIGLLKKDRIEVRNGKVNLKGAVFLFGK